jgi:hypothetical protein
VASPLGKAVISLGTVAVSSDGETPPHGTVVVPLETDAISLETTAIDRQADAVSVDERLSSLVRVCQLVNLGKPAVSSRFSPVKTGNHLNLDV